MTQEVLKMALEVNESMKDVLKQVNELIAENKALKEALAQTQEQVIQDSTCARHCEANAFQITIKNLKAQLATSPQRTWVSLTDEDKHEIELRAGITEDDDGYIVSQVFKLTEAKLKQKNGYAEEKNT